MTPKKVKVRVRCRHCKFRRGDRARGLCDWCWTNHRALYPKGHDDYGGGRNPGDNPAHKLPDAPTDHPPGTPGKLAVLEARAFARVSLHHPEDADSASASNLLELLAWLRRAG